MEKYIHTMNKEALLAEALHYITIIDAKDKYIQTLTEIISRLQEE